MIMKKTLLGALAVFGFATASNAHTVGIGYLDNGNGSVTMYAEHWHGDLTSPYSDNLGLGIFDAVGTFLYRTPWVSVLNNVDFTDSLFGAGGTSALTGYIPDLVNGGAGAYDDWLVSAPLVLGDGTWGFYTGGDCCVDTMGGILYATLSGITSVDPGTGPGNVSPVPLPASGLLLLGGLGAVFGARRRKQV